MEFVIGVAVIAVGIFVVSLLFGNHPPRKHDAQESFPFMIA